jgi:hypothetical protein
MLLLPLVLMAGSSAAECLRYDTDVLVIGKLSEQTFPEQPNYESVEKGDAPATYFFITPGQMLCALAGVRNDEPAGEIESMQLVFPANANAYKALRPSLGSEVECTGKLMPASSGHHHTPILLADAVCHPR